MWLTKFIGARNSALLGRVFILNALLAKKIFQLRRVNNVRHRKDVRCNSAKTRWDCSLARTESDGADELCSGS
jgi:hypothetical protein